MLKRGFARPSEGERHSELDQDFETPSTSGGLVGMAFVDEVPKSASGKILRKIMRE